MAKDVYKAKNTNIYGDVYDGDEVPTPPELYHNMLSHLPVPYKNEIETVLLVDAISIEEIIAIYEEFPNAIITVLVRKSRRLRRFKIDLEVLNIYNINIVKLTTNNLLSWNPNMSFGLIIGNPPYQLKDNDDEAPWLKILNNSFSLLDENGYIFFITPSKWLGKRTITKKTDYGIYSKYQLVYVELFDDIKASEYFPDVGSTFSWYMIKNKLKIVGECTQLVSYEHGTPNKPIEIEFQFDGIPYPKIINAKTLSIHDKLITNVDKVFPFFRTTEFHGQKLKNNKKVVDEKTDEFKNLIYYSRKLQRYTCDQYKYFNDHKVMVGVTGQLNNVWLDDHCSTNEDIQFFVVDTVDEGNNTIDILNKNIYRYFDKMYRPGRNLNFLHCLPYVDISRKWSNEELYQHFNLQEDIDFIEETIK